MKSLGLILCALVLAGHVSADVIIDGFGNSAGPLNPTAGNPSSQSSTVTINGGSADRNFTASVGGDAAMTTAIQDINWIMEGSSTSGAFNSQLEYNGFNLDLSSTPYLQFDVNTVSGSPLLYVMIQSSSGGQVSGAVPLSASENGTSLSFDLRQMNGYSTGFLNGVNDILIGVGGNGSTALSSIDEISFSSAPGDTLAIPEPSTMTLIGSVALFLFAVHFRKASRARV